MQVETELNVDDRISKLEEENKHLKDLLKNALPSMWTHFEYELKQANYQMCDKVRNLIKEIKSKVER